MWSSRGEGTEVSGSRDGSLSGEERTRPQTRNLAAYKKHAEDLGHTEGRPAAGPGTSAQRRPLTQAAEKARRPPCVVPSPVTLTDNETQPSTDRSPDLPGAHLQPLSVYLNLPPTRHSRNLRAARHKGTRSQRTARAGRGFQPMGAGLWLLWDTRGHFFSASRPGFSSFR